MSTQNRFNSLPLGGGRGWGHSEASTPTLVGEGQK